MNITTKTRSLLLAMLFLTTLTSGGWCAKALSEEKKQAEIESQISKIIKEMSVEQKIGQLNQPVLVQSSLDQIKEGIRKGEIGSLCVTKSSNFTPQLYNELQRIALEESELKIPIITGFDVIHGFKTIFPISLAMASTWNEAALTRANKIAATEARAWGVNMSFAPMVDISRDPRWGRICESAGEDVLLNARMGRAAVKGFQNDKLSEPTTVASCAKHFVGYGLSQGGRDKQFTEISKRSLLDTYLPPFKACVDAGATAIMTAFNDVSGVPSTANHYTLTQILKNQWGFKGFTLSDWDAVVELIDHGIAKDKEDAAKQALMAGTDVEMKSDCFKELKSCIEEETISNEKLDEAVRRVLRAKFALNLFNNPYANVEEASAIQLAPDHLNEARKIAAESMILLKNNDKTLPINNKKYKSIAVKGRFTHSQDLYGHWKGNGDINDAITPWEGLITNLPKSLKLIDGTKSNENADICIVCVGEPSKYFGETHCRSNIEIEPKDIEAVKEAKKRYKRVVVALFCGRPMVITPINEIADAILVAWHGGTESGNGLADIIYGDVNPSGKTTCSMLKTTGQTPIYYSDRNSGRPRTDRYDDIDGSPLYPFGYGLSYSNFEYNFLRLSKSSMTKDGSIDVSVEVKNKSAVDGMEVVQLYTQDIVASTTRPQKELKDFKKVMIRAGETVAVTFKLKAEQLAFYNLDLEKVVESGDFNLWVGTSSQQNLHTTFKVE